MSREVDLTHAFFPPLTVRHMRLCKYQDTVSN
jgi:hypothetical protein